MTSSEIHTLTDMVRKAKHITAFTGAGMSTDSGIPDFRSSEGKWSKVTPVMFQDFIQDDDSRFEYWRQKSEAFESFGDAQPNTGHQLLAYWEQHRTLNGIVTQNIDGLHQDAGNQLVIELHGTEREVHCLQCEFRDNAEEYNKRFLANRVIPDCPACQTGLLKHATISFGQQLDETVLRAATTLMRKADLLIVMGSSLVVEPAASLPVIAKQNGAKLVIINRDHTQLDSFADLVINESITHTIQATEDLLRQP
tara:strand:+ start:857 stop:1615 length:759 start_codon:yes stop_codon:yes gene_type:complete